MNRLQINQPPPLTLKLLKAGRAPRLLTTCIIPACANAPNTGKREKSEDEKTAVGSLFSESANALSASSKSESPIIKLLGKIKGGMPGEQFALPGECPKCRVMSSLKKGETTCPCCRLTPLFDELVKEQKLSAAAWERIRRSLCLPKLIKNLSPKQSRAACQLIDLFVERFSFDEQAAMTNELIKKALVELPGLPRLFGKSLKKTVAAGYSSSGAKRRPISTAKFIEIAARQGSFCFWCGIKVVRESGIPQKNRIAKNHSTVVYLSACGEVREEAFGTIDHLIRVTDGGDNSAENLVISCYPCNQEREVKTLTYNREVARHGMSCGGCDGRFFHPDRGCCSICGATNEGAKKSSGFIGKIVNYLTKITSE